MRSGNYSTTVKRSSFFKRFVSETPFSTRLPYAGFVNPFTAYCEDGQMISMMELEGINGDFISEESLETTMKQLSQVWARNHKYQIYIHLVREKIEFPINQESDEPEPLQEWHSKLASSNHYRNTWLLTLVRGGSGKPLNTLLSKFQKQRYERYQNVAHTFLKDTMHLKNQLKPWRPRILGVDKSGKFDRSEIVEALGLIVNGQSRALPFNENLHIASLLPTHRLKFSGSTIECERNDQMTYASILSCRGWPQAIRADAWRNLSSIDGTFILTLSFRPYSRSGSLSRIHNIRREASIVQSETEQIHEELDDAQDAVTREKLVFGKSHLTIQVSAATKKAVSENIEAVEEACLGFDWVQETTNTEAAYLAQFPGNARWITRTADLTTENLACMGNFLGSFQGNSDNLYLGQPVMFLSNRQGEPYALNLHVDDVGSTAIVGQTGRGKTVLAAMLQAGLERIGVRTLWLDVSRSSELYIRARGGQYTRIIEGEPTGLNPFNLPTNPQSRRFLKRWVAYALLGLTDESHAREREQVHEAVEALLKRPVEQRTLSNLEDYLPHIGESGNTTIERMKRWTQDSGWLFDHAGNTSIEQSMLQGIDLTSILNLPERGAFVWYLLQLLEQNIQAHGPIAVIWEEAWKFLDDPELSRHIANALVEIRKKGANFILVTQSPSQMLESSAHSAISQSVPTQIFVGDRNANLETYGKQFPGMTQDQVDAISELGRAGRRQIMMRWDQRATLLDFDLSDQPKWLTLMAGNKETLTIADRLWNEQGSDDWVNGLLKEVIK